MIREQMRCRIHSFIKEGLTDLLCLDGSAYEDLEDRSKSGTVTEENIKYAICEDLYYFFEGFRADDEAVNRFKWTLDDAGLHWHETDTIE